MNVKSIKKGFTLTELIIVIVIIGILAGVLIPTFINVVNKANKAADLSLIRNLNEALTLDRYDNGEHKNMTQALKAADDYGFAVDKIDAKVSKNKILWDSQNDVFCYLVGEDTLEYYPQSVKSGDEIHPEDDNENYLLWIIDDEVNSKFSTYLFGYTNDKTTEAKPLLADGVGLDTGKCDVAFVKYVNTSTTAKNVVIRTNSFATTLTINAPADTVNHYGNAAIVNVEKIAGASYHENGTVGRLTVEEGHAVAEANATIFCFIDAGSDTTATVEVKSGAVVYDKNGENKGQEAVVEGTHDDCGAGHHDFGTQLVIDNKVYEVCKSCGYTLVHVVDEITGQDTLTVKVDSSNNIVNTPVETFNNNSESVNEDGTVKSDATPSIAAVDASTLNTTCSHEFGEPEVVQATCYSTGSKTYTCTKCGETMTTTIAKTAHKYYDNPSEADSLQGTYHEKCLYNALCHNDRGDVNVAKIGETEYRTLRQAIAAVTDNTPTTITMIADEAIYGNAGYTIAAGRDITIDLNGHKICNYVTDNAASKVFAVAGNLTIKDSTDVNSDGTGYGVIYNDYDRSDENLAVGEWWSTPRHNYSTNVILVSGGLLTINSGKIVNTTGGSICYGVDFNYYAGSVVINGGLIQSAATGVRLYVNGNDITVTMNGGRIKSHYDCFRYHVSSAKNGKLYINNGIIESDTEAISNYGDNYTTYINYYLEINGGTIIGDIDLWEFTAEKFIINGGTINGDVISTGTVTYSGGTINGSLKEEYVELAVWYGSGYLETGAINGEDFVFDTGVDLSNKVVSAVYYSGNETIDSSKISVNGSVITIDKSALHKFTGNQFCIWISISDPE